MLTPAACVQILIGSLQTSGPLKTSFTIPLPLPLVTKEDKNNILHTQNKAFNIFECKSYCMKSEYK